MEAKKYYTLATKEIIAIFYRVQPHELQGAAAAPAIRQTGYMGATGDVDHFPLLVWCIDKSGYSTAL